MIEMRQAVPPPLDFTEVEYVDAALAKRRLVYVVGLALCLVAGIIAAGCIVAIKYRLERDTAQSMVSKGNKTAPKTVATATVATNVEPAKQVGQTFITKKPFLGEVKDSSTETKPTPTSNKQFLLGSKAPVKAELNTDAKVVMIATVFDLDSAMALKDEVVEAVNNCNSDRSFELCVKPVRGGRSYAALVMSKAGLVPVEAERIASCFKKQQNKDAIIVAASKYRSPDCL